jgi:hypothetical protein
LQVAEKLLEEYNSDYPNHPLKIVMHDYAVEHLVRINRVIRRPSGHLLMIGVGGSGRESLVRLAAYIGDLDIFQIEPTMVLCSLFSWVYLQKKTSTMNLPSHSFILHRHME